jgi:hypothetical protein
MAKTRAIATWVDPAGHAKTFDYAGRGNPTHCVIDVANDGEFVGWTKDPDQYMRRREADHGEMVALDLVYGDAEDTAARDEYGYAGTEAAQPETVVELKGGPAPLAADAQIKHYVESMGAAAVDTGVVNAHYGGDIAPDITPESTSWSVYFSRTSTVDLLERMSLTAQYTVTAATEAAKATFRDDLDKMRAEVERRKAAGQLVGVPHVAEAFVPNTEVVTVVPTDPEPVFHANLPDGSVFVQHEVGGPTMVEPAEPAPEPVKPKRKTRAKKAKAVATIDVNAERHVTRDYPQPMSTYALVNQQIPNHFVHDSLGDPMTCTENHNHPDPIPNELDVTNAVEAARAQVAEVSTVMGTYAARTLDVAQTNHASIARGELHRALYLIGAVARFTDPVDRVWTAQLAKAVAIDAFDHAANVAQSLAEAKA